MDGLWPFQFVGAEFWVTLMLLHISSKENVPIETFHIIFESTQNKQQYGTKIGGGLGGGVMVITYRIFFFFGYDA